MDSWFKDTDIILSSSRGYQIKWQKTSQREVVHFQPEDYHKTALNTS